ncbi:bacteriorhodopsin [Thiorhodococcus minor]|uniref:Bacteriorhodopsin n=1 Tax=Thiorhodococcus minor TaxID=57489 RepID=A0A6M0K4H3_9GAMM|nr:bacteriorhodopsin [Thiorhodococcus minor]NEV64184.1 hypothetical protein [Thiorhodococcus minor]
MTTLFNLTYFSFLACGLAAILAVVYFVIQAPKLNGRLRLLALLNIIVCAASSVLHLYFFTRLQPIAAGAAGVNEMAAAIGELPLIVRYGYWLATTAMLIVMFPLLMGIERVGAAFAVKLILIDAAMISTGYLGERSTLAGDGVSLTALTWFTISGMLWMYMTFSIFQVLRRLPSEELIPAQRDALIYMFFFFLIGWAIFPAGFFYAMVFDSGVGVVLREFTVNVGDIVNKVLWGFLVVYAAREISKSLRAEDMA